MKPRVYLAGPITGINYAGAVEWRQQAIDELKAAGIVGLSPMRGKDYLRHVDQFTMDGDAYKPFSVMSSNRGIMTRDRWDATRCDALLVNLLGAEKVSVGTVMEIAWADLSRIPIICAIESEGNPHDHGMITEAIGFRVPTLPEGIHIIKAMLSQEGDA